ncbi:MAG: DNA double-strand break repair nuclease NurA [Thaumarchaeota archaeon]|nr:DNA double-strand break repair nuclease NurA [Nitrososphaerota archaeon]
MLGKMNKQLSLPIDISKHASSLADQIESAIKPCTVAATTRLLHSTVIFGDGERDLAPMGGWGRETFELHPAGFSASSDPRVLASIDSSCIPVAETMDGSAYAARVAAVFSYGGRIQSFAKFGPMLLYIDETAALGLFQGLRKRNFAKMVLMDRRVAQRMIRTRLERAVASKLASEMEDCVLMIDGALSESVLDSIDVSLDSIISSAKAIGSHVVGISKTSRVRFLSRASSRLQSADAPSYINVHDYMRCLFKGLLGRVVVAKFDENAFPFRVDVAACDNSNVGDVLSAVRFNDVFIRGYPESLRIAHHLSVFSRHEALCVGSYLAKQGEVKSVFGEDLRHSVLGEIRVGRMSGWGG